MRARDPQDRSCSSARGGRAAAQGSAMEKKPFCWSYKRGAASTAVSRPRSQASTRAADRRRASRFGSPRRSSARLRARAAVRHARRSAQLRGARRLRLGALERVRERIALAPGALAARAHLRERGRLGRAREPKLQFQLVDRRAATGCGRSARAESRVRFADVAASRNTAVAGARGKRTRMTRRRPERGRRQLVAGSPARA